MCLCGVESMMMFFMHGVNSVMEVCVCVRSGEYDDVSSCMEWTV